MWSCPILRRLFDVERGFVEGTSRRPEDIPPLTSPPRVERPAISVAPPAPRAALMPTTTTTTKLPTPSRIHLRRPSRRLVAHLNDIHVCCRPLRRRICCETWRRQGTGKKPDAPGPCKSSKFLRTCMSNWSIT